MERQILEGNVSIVIDWDTTLNENHKFFQQILNSYTENCGIKEFKDSKGLVKVHCESLNLGICYLSDWAKEGIDALVPRKDVTSGEWLALRDNNRFPNYLPIELFMGKKEGDIISFASKWGEVCLHLCQDKWQTGIEPFHQVLKRLFQI